MEYKDVEEVWTQRVAQQSARYESEIVAITLSNKEELERLKSENERLKSELAEAKATGATAS